MAKIMTVNLTNTIIGQEVDGWWIFTDIMAERVSNIIGTKLVKSFCGHVKSGFPAKDECLYTGKLVKNGYKLCIIK